MKWYEFEREDFTFNGFDCILVHPNKAREGKPFVWRAEFFGAFDQCDREMAARGYHVAYIRLSNKYGCPWAVTHMKEFYDYLVGERGLDAKPLIFGFSRGGLYTMNFALTYPQCVGKCYLDAPVLYVMSWPGDRSRGYAAQPEWNDCLTCYDAAAESIVYKRAARPVLRGAEFAALGIPLALVAGAVDTCVSYKDNSEPFLRDFLRAGGKAFVRVKPDCDHHPHSLEDPTELCDFLCSDIK